MKYYKAEDIIAFLNLHCPKDMWEYQIADLPTIEVSEEDELKFYYVDSIDDYWIGQRLDNFYYAKWNSKLGFVWSASRYLSWGEHVVAPDTLWKEHTYPSEPREIPFTEWIVGFMKKYGSEVSEEAISREWVLNRLAKYQKDYASNELDDWQNTIVEWITTDIEDAPSVLPKPKEGEWIPCSERLPKEKDAGLLKKLGTEKRSEYVLATVEVEGERMTVTACTYDGIWHWDKKYAFPDFKVVAWMPLPKPWKGADDE